MAKGGPGRRWAVIALAVLLLAGGTLWAFNHGPTPERWLVALTASLTEQLGAEVSIEAVRLAGVDRIALHGVRVGGDVPVEVRRVVAAFSVGELWRKRDTPLAALRWVSVEDWGVELPADTLYELPWLDSLLADDGSDAAPEYGETRSGEPPSGKEATDRLKLPALGALTDALMGHQWVDGTLDVYVGDGRIGFVRDGATSAGEGDGIKGAQDGQAALQLHMTGTVALGEEQLLLRHVKVAMTDWQATINGTALPRPDLYVNITGDATGEAVGKGSLPWRLPVRAAGTLRGEAWLTGRWEALDAWGNAHVRSAVIIPLGGEPLPATDEHTGEHALPAYGADDVIIEWTYRPEHGIGVMLNAARDGARLNMQGDIAGDGRLNLAVVAANVRVPGDVPALGQWDLNGQVDVSGTLMGTLAAPVLVADVVSDGGYLFGQPFSALQGMMKLTDGEFAFERVRVTQGTSDYFLDGVLRFAESTDPMGLQLVLRTDNGRAEALTAVLGWDVPVQSGVAGTLEFDGPLGDIAAEGELTLTRGSAWQQPFDSVTGRFRYVGGAFAVTDVVGTVRGGTITASGGSLALIEAEGNRLESGPRVRVTSAEGDATIKISAAAPEESVNVRSADQGEAAAWRLQLAVEDVPIQAAPMLRERLPMVSGLLGFEGTLSNDSSQWNPRLTGTVTGRHIFVGSFDFVDASGEIEWLNGTLSSKGLTLQRRNGGVYDVTGHVHDVLDRPRLDIAVGVEGESVGQLLALTDWRLPLLAHSEPVRADVVLHGTPDDPEAIIRVETDAVYIVGRPLPVALDLRLRDGRIEVEELSEPTSRT